MLELLGRVQQRARGARPAVEGALKQADRSSALVAADARPSGRSRRRSTSGCNAARGIRHLKCLCEESRRPLWH